MADKGRLRRGEERGRNVTGRCDNVQTGLTLSLRVPTASVGHWVAHGGGGAQLLDEAGGGLVSRIRGSD